MKPSSISLVELQSPPTCSSLKGEVRRILSLQPPQKSSQPQPRASWWLPPPDLLKINFDGTSFVVENKYGISVVIGDNQGMVIAFLSQKLP